VQGKQWAELDDRTHQVKWYLEETARSVDYIELSNAANSQSWRLHSNHMDFRVGQGRWQWLAQGYWLDPEETTANTAVATTEKQAARAPNRLIQVFGHHTSAVRAATFTRDGRQALSASFDHMVRLWDIKTGEEIDRMAGHNGVIDSMDLSPDGKRILTASWDNHMILWDVASGNRVREFYDDPGFILRDLSFSPDGGSAVTCSDRRDNNTVVSHLLYWDLESGERLREVVAPSPTWSIDWSPTEPWVLSGGTDGLLRLWGTEGSGELRNWTANSGSPIMAVTFSVDGRFALSAGRDSRVVLWNLRTFSKTTELRTTLPEAAAISPDNQRALTGGFDQVMRLWDLASGKEIARLEGHAQTIRSVGFSPDGRQAISASDDGSVRVWQLPP